MKRGVKKFGSNKAQMQISFGMIFSILLIIVFIAFAFFGIKKFMEVQNGILGKKFIDDLNNDLEKVWKSARSSEEVSYSLPDKVESVCFGEKNTEYENDMYNVYFLPEGEFDGGKLNRVDFEKTLNGEEELCFPVKNKKVSFVLSKSYGETLVTISKNESSRETNYGGNTEGNVNNGDGNTNLDRNTNFGGPIDSKSYEEVLNNPNVKILYKNNFQQRPLGKYATLAEFVSDWQTSSGWGNRGEEFEVVADPGQGGNDNNVGMFTFPHYDVKDFKWICWDDGCGDSDNKRIYFNEEPTTKKYTQLLNGVGPYSGGSQWYVDLGGKYNDVYVMYNIKFSPNFDGLNGGKLFGVYGQQDNAKDCGACVSTDCDNDGVANSFVSKHMFHSGSISYYLYYFNKKEVCGDSWGVDNSNIYDGNWHTLILHTVLNNVDQSNGIVETWIDGVKRNSVTGIKFKAGADVFGIQQLGVTTFFGGSAEDRCYEAMDYNNENCGGKKIAPYFAHGCPNNTDPEKEAWCEGLKRCVKDINNPCSDIQRYSDGSPVFTFAPKKTEYIYVDNIVVYTSN
jgi:hypothetical protein